MDRKTVKCAIDGVGRVTIPHLYRKALGIEPFDYVDVLLTEQGMMIYKENKQEVLKKKIIDIVDAANDCTAINNDERIELNNILSKLF